MNRVRHAVILLVLAVALLVSAACGIGPAAEGLPTAADDTRPPERTAHGGSTGGERTTAPIERLVLTGVATGMGRSTFDGEPVRRITVEEDPDARCSRGPTTPGCEKMIFTVDDDTRMLGDEGCDGEGVEDASADDLTKGEKVRADYTGYGVAESYPGQTTARSVSSYARGHPRDPTPHPTARARTKECSSPISLPRTIPS